MISDEQCQQVKDFVKHYLHESFKKSDQEWKKNFPRSAEYRWNSGRAGQGKKWEGAVIGGMPFCSVLA